MQETTGFIQKVDDNGESRMFKLSVRAWLAIFLTVTICALEVTGAIINIRRGEPIKISESVGIQWGMVLAFYFGQNLKPK